MIKIENSEIFTKSIQKCNQLGHYFATYSDKSSKVSIFIVCIDLSEKLMGSRNPLLKIDGFLGTQKPMLTRSLHRLMLDGRFDGSNDSQYLVPSIALRMGSQSVQTSFFDHSCLHWNDVQLSILGTSIRQIWKVRNVYIFIKGSPKDQIKAPLVISTI